LQADHLESTLNLVPVASLEEEVAVDRSGWHHPRGPNEINYFVAEFAESKRNTG